MDHRGRDFTIQVVAGEVEFHEPPKPANLWRDCPGYVVFLQQTVDTDGYNERLALTVRKGERNSAGHKGYHLPYP